MPADDEIKSHVASACEAAAKYGGVVSRASAAAAWGWDLLSIPPRAEITVPKGRRNDFDRAEVSVRRTTLPPADVEGRLTTRRRTLVDCARALHFEEALTIADSALRSGYPRVELRQSATAAKGPGSIRVRLVAHHADRNAANVFESRLRAICLRVSGLNVTPQVRIGSSTEFLGRPDLVDVTLRIVVEADSFEWHGQRPALVADTRRYNSFVTAGWLVVRFTWEDVMHHPELVAEVLRDLVAVARTNRDGWAA